MNDGPNDAAADNAAEPVNDLLPGFDDTTLGIGNLPEPDGQPETAEAVEQTDDVDAPETTDDPVVEAPAADATDDSDPGDAETEDAKPNFDGFSDVQKTTWERLYEAGHATKEEVETARTESLFQSAWTKKTTALKRKEESWDADVEERKEDLALLDQIRGDDALHAKWMKMQQADAVDDDFDGEELVDRATAERIAEEKLKRLLDERDAGKSKEQQRYDTLRSALDVAAAEAMEIHGLSREVMDGYLQAEVATLPEGTDPILTVTPAELHERVAKRHGDMGKDAKIAALEAQLSKRTSKDDRTSRQSLPPPRRVASGSGGDKNALQQTEADLGLTDDWSNVSGFGHPTNR